MVQPLHDWKKVDNHRGAAEVVVRFYKCRNGLPPGGQSKLVCASLLSMHKILGITDFDHNLINTVALEICNLAATYQQYFGDWLVTNWRLTADEMATDWWLCADRLIDCRRFAMPALTKSCHPTLTSFQHNSSKYLHHGAQRQPKKEQETKIFQYCTCSAGWVTYNFHSSCKHMHLSFKSICNKEHKGVICNMTSSSNSSQSARPVGQVL